MASKISTRVAQIIAALKNDDPKTDMSQAIREICSVIEEVGVELGRVTAEKHLALSKLAEQKLAAGLKKGGTHLIDTERQLHVEAQISRLEQKIGAFSKEEKEMEAYLIALRTKKCEMEKKLRQLKTKQHHR